VTEEQWNALAQKLLDAGSDLYSAYYFHSGKTDTQFDCMDQFVHVAAEARVAGLTIKCKDPRDPDPPKPDLPLFNAYD
jgi:hypothetical protein